MTPLLRLLRNRVAFATIVVLVLILGGLWTWINRVPADAQGAVSGAVPQTGFPAPDFTLETLDGEVITLSELQGQVVVVNLWATWCPPCRAEMPALERVWNDYRDQGLLILAVDQREPPATVSAFAEEFGLSFPILLDRDGAVGARYQLRAYPTTFFVGRDGVIRDMILGGPMSEALIASTVVEMLEE
jgi:peroxiredoxin